METQEWRGDPEMGILHGIAGPRKGASHGIHEFFDDCPMEHVCFIVAAGGLYFIIYVTSSLGVQQGVEPTFTYYTW